MDTAEQPAVEDRLYTAAEIAGKLAMTGQFAHQTITRWCAEGKIPAAVKEPNILRFDWPAVKAALASRVP